MPQQPSASIENNFTAGLKTEFTGLNFPENAATDTSNCFYSVVGSVTRRLGYDFENNYATESVDVTGNAINTYEWTNAGGDGDTQILVVQCGNTLLFYKISDATEVSPLSNQLLETTVTLDNYRPSGSSLSVDDIECQFSDGNGYLFVYHPHCDPFYCVYDPTLQTVTGLGIQLYTRDLEGWSEGGSVLDVKIRPNSLSDIHKYNLINQGWSAGGLWSAQATGTNAGSGGVPVGARTWVVPAGLPINIGQTVYINTRFNYGGLYLVIYTTGIGIVSSYSGTTLVVAVNRSIAPPYPVRPGFTPSFDVIDPTNIGVINTFFSATGTYPSNADVWWNFKNSNDAFDPATTLGNVTIGSPAPKGAMILNAFNMNRAAASSVTTIPTISTNVRPRTGTWFQGRVWYAGVDAFQSAVGTTSPYYTWTENIYFSQIVSGPEQFGLCMQKNDPTNEDLFALLPDDGGIINIQGSGAIYKLFPIQNGMLVFAANGIWFITGSQGIGFTANDYTITKISEIKAISGNSFVNVQGLPYFWNGDGIYTVTPAQQGLGLQIKSLTYSTIDTFFNKIPMECRKFARGDYNPIDYVIQWVYRDEDTDDVTERHRFNKILNFNTQTQSFYPYEISSSESTPYVHGVNFIQGPGGLGLEDPSWKYLTSFEDEITFSEEWDEDFKDWASAIEDGVTYDSFFTTGYKIRGQGQRKYQPGYVYMYSNNNLDDMAYKIQGIFDYANNRNSGQYSSIQLADYFRPNYGIVVKRHKLRGQGLVLQLKIMSVQNKPFDIIGWSIWETANTGV